MAGFKSLSNRVNLSGFQSVHSIVEQNIYAMQIEANQNNVLLFQYVFVYLCHTYGYFPIPERF